MNNNIKQNLVKKHNTLLYKLKIKYSNLSNQNKNKLTNFYKTDININLAVPVKFFFSL